MGATGSPTPWCTDGDISVAVAAAGVSGVDLSAMCQAATEILFKLSGEQFDQRTDTLRPHRLSAGCDCAGAGWWPDWWSRIGGWGCGCEAGDEIVLPGPVSQLVEVTVDGTTVSNAAALAAAYAVFDGRRLVRLETATGFTSWPCCQRLAAPLTEVGTWSVRFTHGKPAPASASLAAQELAYQFALAKGNSGACKLPERVRSVVHQGVTVAIADAFEFLDKGGTGLYFCDLFLAAFNPDKLRRRARVYSPDLPHLASP